MGLLNADGSELFVSAASWWELSIKRALGRLRFDAGDVLAKLSQASVSHLDITFAHAERAAALPVLHGDPFDRMLVAQSVVEGLTVMTRDRALEGYGIATTPA